MAEFAKAQLLKYGWTEGKGLGKYENGIAEALKPKLKFDTTGVGHDSSEYHWWEFVYNTASNNITVDTKANGVKMKIKDKNAVDIKTSKSELNLEKIKREQDLQYGSFVKTSTLENGKVTKDPNYMEEKFESSEKISQQFMLNDEDLFKACGGRTAHKGARHGLTLNGKLARIERQEQELLKMMNAQNNSADWIQVENKRKKKKKNSEKMDVEKESHKDTINSGIEVQSSPIKNDVINLDCENVPVPSRKARKKAKRRLQNLTHQLTTSLVLSEDSVSNKQKKSTHELGENNTESSGKSGKKRKHKKKHCDKVNDNEIKNEDDDIEIIEDVDCIIEPAAKKYKGDVILDACVLNSKIEKRKKYKKNKKERQEIEKLTTNFTTLNVGRRRKKHNYKCRQE
ncbi:hypothetical protein PV326_013906 [Microctonus aethiopoides]|uniref:G patch domain-containing protein 4 n=1 Tax=Microctonus aethiopoides TaxID=144406 RepID=A0AA39C5I5_9HYME|nr:hypothetical protein PV326_013906 [Microctonus aethiopoides]KAK0158272.1 hypothetical protein PV328_009296 [Microctonus aethiopoides]